MDKEIRLNTVKEIKAMNFIYQYLYYNASVEVQEQYKILYNRLIDNDKALSNLLKFEEYKK